MKSIDQVVVVQLQNVCNFVIVSTVSPFGHFGAVFKVKNSQFKKVCTHNLNIGNGVSRTVIVSQIGRAVVAQTYFENALATAFKLNL